jgi:hypothetical protein
MQQEETGNKKKHELDVTSLKVNGLPSTYQIVPFTSFGSELRIEVPSSEANLIIRVTYTAGKVRTQWLGLGRHYSEGINVEA